MIVEWMISEVVIVENLIAKVVWISTRWVSGWYFLIICTSLVEVNQSKQRVTDILIDKIIILLNISKLIIWLIHFYKRCVLGFVFKFFVSYVPSVFLLPTWLCFCFDSWLLGLAWGGGNSLLHTHHISWLWTLKPGRPRHTEWWLLSEWYQRLW